MTGWGVWGRTSLWINGSLALTVLAGGERLPAPGETVIVQGAGRSNRSAAAIRVSHGGPFVYIHFIEGKAPAPLSLKSTASPAAGVVKTYQAAGNLTLHGHSRAVTFPLSAERTGAGLEVSGSIPVTFADWGIGNPSFGSFVTTQNHGELEFLLKLARS